jgi:hypothetical protein
MPLTAAEQKELDQLEYDKLLAERDQAVGFPGDKQPVQEKNEDSTHFSPEEDPKNWDANGKWIGPRNPRTGLPDLRDTAKMGRVLERGAAMGARSALPAVGQSLGVGLAPVTFGLSVPTFGALGGAAGEVLGSAIEGETPGFGRVLAAAGTGAIPGASLAKAGAREIGKEAIKLGAANLGSTVVEKAIDEGRLPTVEEAAVSTAGGVLGAPASKIFSKVVSARAPLYDLEMETAREMRKRGFVIPPHEIGEGSDTLSSIGGKYALQQEAAKRNQFPTQVMARETLGLSKEAVPIRISELKALRDSLAAPYRDIQAIQKSARDQLDQLMAKLNSSSDAHAVEIAMNEPATKELVQRLQTLAAADVDQLKIVRDLQKSARKSFFNGNPQAYDTWQNAKEQASKLEDVIEEAASMSGDAKLLERLRHSRQKIAESYSVEEALNPGNGFVDNAILGRQLLNGEPLSGNLEKLGRFAVAFRREAVESSRVPAPGVGNLGAQMSTAMMSQGNPAGVVGGIINATAGRVVRPFLLSDMMQNQFVNPVTAQNFSAAMARYMAEKSAEEAAEN